MPEPIGVAFVEIEPVAVGFRAKAEAQVRGQMVASRVATAAHSAETAAIGRKTVAATGAAAAEGRAAAATHAHATASRHAAREIAAEAGAMAGLRGAAAAPTAALAAIAAGVFGLFKSLEAADEFNETMHRIEVATHATEEQLHAAREAAIALGEDLSLPGTTAQESADAINLLVRSGFDLEEAMTAARGALLLEAAAAEGLQTSVQQVDRVLDAFNLKAEDSVRVADAIATGLKFTQDNASEFATALSQIAPAADSLGLSLEDTNTLVLQLSESGLSTTQAAGSLRQAFLKLAAGGKGVNDGLKRIGLNMSDLRDEMGRLRPDAFVILAEAMEDLDRATRLQILTQIFSRRAALGVIRIIEQQRLGFEQMREKALETGTALDEGTAKTKSFGGQLKELKHDLADIGIIIGQSVLPPVMDLIGAFRDGLGPTKRWIEQIQDLTGQSGGLPAAFGKAKVAAQDYVNIIGQLTGADEPMFITPTIVDNVSRRRIRQAREDIEGLFKAFEAGGTDSMSGANEFVLGLRRVQDSLIKTTPAGKAASKEIDKLIKAVQDGADLPPIKLDVEVDVDADSGKFTQEAEDAARRAGDTLRANFILAGRMGFPEIAQHGLDMIDALISGVEKGQDKVKTAGADTVRNFSLGADLAIAQAAGDEAGQLSILRKQLANAQRHQKAMEQAFKEGRVNEQAVINAANRVSSIKGQIASILSGQASDAAAAAADAEAAAAEIEQAADKRDQAFLRAINAQFSDKQGAVSAASMTERISDDIRANLKLRNWLNGAVADVQARIRQVRAAGRSTEALAQELAVLRRARNAVKREIDALQAQAKQQQSDTRVEQARLDLQILETRVGSDPTAGQQAAIVAAHRRVIRALKLAQRLVGRRTVEWKRLQLEIEQELAAIRDLKSTQDGAEGGKDFSQQAFAFLQELHGFTNIASNISGTTASFPGFGARGGSSTSSTAPPRTSEPLGIDPLTGRPLRESGGMRSPFSGGSGAAAAAAAREQRGGQTTFGQMETLLHVAKNTNDILRDIRRGLGHPAAKHNRGSNRHPVETGVD